MPPNLANEIRLRIIALRVDAGWTLRRIATHLHVSVGAVQRCVRVHRQTGDIIDLPRAGRPPATDHEDDEFLSAQSRANPFITRPQLRTLLRQRHRRNVSLSTISTRLLRAGLPSYNGKLV